MLFALFKYFCQIVSKCGHWIGNVDILNIIAVLVVTCKTIEYGVEESVVLIRTHARTQTHARTHTHNTHPTCTH